MEKSDEEATGGAAVSGPSGAGRTKDGEEEGSKFRPTGEYRRHDIHHNDTQHKAIRHDELVCDTQHKRHLVLCVIMLSAAIT
jgi:hypothetical protein